jgi:hypothetical protein
MTKRFSEVSDAPEMGQMMGLRRVRGFRVWLQSD